MEPRSYGPVYTDDCPQLFKVLSYVLPENAIASRSSQSQALGDFCPQLPFRSYLPWVPPRVERGVSWVVRELCWVIMIGGYRQTPPTGLPSPLPLLLDLWPQRSRQQVPLPYRPARTIAIGDDYNPREPLSSKTLSLPRMLSTLLTLQHRPPPALQLPDCPSLA